MERLCDLRAVRLAEKKYGQQLRELRHCDPGWNADSRILSMLWYSRTGRWPIFEVTREGGEVVLDADGTDDVPIRVPHHSAEIELALTLYPDDAGLGSWDGNAHTCCTAALKLVGKRLFSRSTRST